MHSVSADDVEGFTRVIDHLMRFPRERRHLGEPVRRRPARHSVAAMAAA